MNPAETAAILRQFNEWRRGDEDIPQFDPRDIGEAIDAAAEMIDRLEAAESEAIEQARLNGMGSEREAALMAKLESAERNLGCCRAEREEAASLFLSVKAKLIWERDALRAKVGKLKDIKVARCVKINGYIVDNARLAEEVERLQANIKQTEQQEPVVWMQSSHLNSFKNRLCGSQSAYVHCSDHQLHPDFKPLYALPGAQGEEK